MQARETSVRIAHRRGWPLLCALSAGCRCSPEPPPAVSSTAAAEVFSCERGAAQLTLSPGGSVPAVAEPGEELGVELPFSAEPGVAVGVGSMFFATALRHEARGAVAVLARMGIDDPAVELLELGRAQGNAAPPRLAVDGEDVIVALQQGAQGGGHEVRVARLRAGAWSAPPEWREAVHQASDESNAFDLGAHAGQALIVWDDWVAAANHGRVVAASIPFELAPAAKIETRAISAAGVDAEAPRVTARPGGYWLGWLVNRDYGAGPRRVYDPGGRDSDDPATTAGARWIEVVALDAAGRLEGNPRRLTPIDQRVVGYDLTRAGDGGVRVVWRQDAPSASSAGGRIFMAELRADGTEEITPVRDEDVGAGEPTFLPTGAMASPWLTFPDARDRTLLMRVDGARAVSAPLRLGADIEGGAALAAIDHRILFALPRGRSIELFAASCRPDAPTGGAARDAGAGRVNTDALSLDAAAPQPRQGETEQKP